MTRRERTLAVGFCCVPFALALGGCTKRSDVDYSPLVRVDYAAPMALDWNRSLMAMVWGNGLVVRTNQNWAEAQANSLSGTYVSGWLRDDAMARVTAVLNAGTRDSSDGMEDSSMYVTNIYWDGAREVVAEYTSGIQNGLAVQLLRILLDEPLEESKGFETEPFSWRGVQ